MTELCCGSAAVSMAALGQKPPAPYMGGKARFARAILHHMEVTSKPRKVLLVDAGPWGDVWHTLSRSTRSQLDVVERLKDLIAVEDIGDAAKALARESVPECRVEHAARFLLLQQLSWRSKAVWEHDGSWVWAGLSETHAYGLAGTPRFGGVAPQAPGMPQRVAALQLDAVAGYRCDVRDLVVPDDIYMDPPYLGTEGYGSELPRADVLAHVSRLVDAGARVTVSEAEALGAPCVRSAIVGQKGKSSGLNTTHRTEWVSMTFPAAQVSLFGSTP